MRLYLGSRDYRPEGFQTVDIDPACQPDILADVTNLSNIASGTVDEICASHVLEHIPWPLSFKALSEWGRVLRTDGRLRVAVPDLGLLARLIAEGRNVWWATGLMFGVGRLENPLEAHQYGFTREMLLTMLRSLGFGQFDWWKHDMPDASNGWMLDDAGGKIAISLNISATKLREPVVDPALLTEALKRDRMQPFDQVLAGIVGNCAAHLRGAAEEEPLLTQRLHMALIEARMRILYLENEVRSRQ